MASSRRADKAPKKAKAPILITQCGFTKYWSMHAMVIFPMHFLMDLNMASKQTVLQDEYEESRKELFQEFFSPKTSLLYKALYQHLPPCLVRTGSHE